MNLWQRISRFLVLVAIFSCTLGGCHQLMGDSKQSDSEKLAPVSYTNSPVEIIAHRGASHDAPENTLAAVNLAWKQDTDAVEVDVYLSADNRIVAVHDKTLKRYGGPDEPIASMTYADLQKHEVGSWKDKKYAGEPIPLLSEILKTIPAGKRLFIEIKCGVEILPYLVAVLEAADLEDEQTAIICFSEEVISGAAKQLPNLKRYWLASLKRDKITQKVKPSIESLIATAENVHSDGLDLGGATDIIDAAYVSELEKHDLPLYIWTVNSVEEAARLKAAGVRGITTDRPKLLRTINDTK